MTLTAAACWACASRNLAPTSRLSPLPFHECPDCGFQQHETTDAAGHYLEDEYGRDRAGDYTEDPAGRRHDARLRVRMVQSKLPAGKLLDVGTAGGAFVAAAAAAGYDASGLEPTPTFAAHARAQGLDVRATTLEDAGLPPDGCDAITMWHVLEHIPAPEGALAIIKDALRPGGRLFVEVPNAGSGIARQMGTAWPLLEPTVHVGQYTSTALLALLERCGFVVDVVKARSILPYARLRQRCAPGALVHRLKWRGQEAELLYAEAAA